MIKNIRRIREFENKIIVEKEEISFEKKMKIFEALWSEGVSLGVLPPKNILEGIETDIKLAKILNSCSSNL